MDEQCISNDGGPTQMMNLLKQIGARGANLAHTFLSCDRTGIAHNDQMWSGITVASMMCETTQVVA